MPSRSEVPEELAEKIRISPPHYIRNFYRHPNDPTRKYDFYDDSGENKLDYLTDVDSHLFPQNWGDINVLLFARGCLKTWSVTSIGGWAVDVFPTLEITATAPRDDQREEVIENFKDRVEESGLEKRRVKDAYKHQKFENGVIDPATGEKITTYSSLKSRSAWSEGDALRGLHSQMGIIDEAQDVDEGTFSTFMEAIDQEIPENSFFPSIFVIGTPKLANTFFHKLWRMSDKRDWDDDAKEWIPQDTPDEFLPESLRRGADWEKIRDFEGYTVRGWHIDQENCPLHEQHRIEFKRETYSKRKFQNEVKAQFYTPENDLLTNDDVFAAFERGKNIGWRTSPVRDETKTVLGVDWGGGDSEGAASTVCTIAEYDDASGKLTPLYIDVFDSSMSKKEQREQIDAYMQQYDVDVAVVDEGYGDTNRAELQDEFGYDNLYGCMYGNVSDKEQLKWNRHNSRKKYFTINRTYMIEQMVQDFKDGEIVLPKQDVSFSTKRALGSQIVDQLTAPYTDRKETSGGRRKLKVLSDRQDDIFHSLVYTWLAAKKVDARGRNRHTIGAHYRRGYNEV